MTDSMERSSGSSDLNHSNKVSESLLFPQTENELIPLRQRIAGEKPSEIIFDSTIPHQPVARGERESVDRIGQVRAALRENVNAQEAKRVTGEFRSFLTRSGDELLAAFEASPAFEKIYEEARVQSVLLDSREYWKGLAGRVFSQMAELSLSARLEQDGTLLPSEAAFDLMKMSRPQRRVIEDPFGTTSLDHTYVPDGFLVSENDLISGVVEYKSGWRLDDVQVEKQYKGYKHIVKELSPLCEEYPLFMLVTPANTRNIPEHPDLQHITIPVSSVRLGRFIKSRYPQSSD